MTHIVKCKMRSLFSKSLLGRVVGTAPGLNLRPELKGLEGNLAISTLPAPHPQPTPNLQAVAEPSQACLALWSLFLKHSRKQSLYHAIF